MYSYNQAGRITGQRLQYSNWTNFDATYTWDNLGRMTSLGYPLNGPTYASQYDSMGRLSGMTQASQPVAAANYNTAGQIASLSYFGFNENRTYNNLNQLTRLTTTGASGLQMDMQYVYTAGQDNGRIAQSIDGVTGENVTYAYDILNRLITATASGQWSNSFGYDGYGNMTGINGGAGTFDPSTNRPSGAASDANGLSPGSPYAPYAWDIENHLTGAPSTYGYQNMTYDPWGKRVMKTLPVSGPLGAEFELYFYSNNGQKLGTYLCEWNMPQGQNPCWQESTNTYFGGKLIQSQGVTVATDRLGSVRANANGERMSYYPYGQERTSTADGREKFAGYFRDSVGQDYADQRYYGGWGSFMSPDPGGIRTANPNNPGSWNRYAYTYGDPVNFVDPGGTEACFADDEGDTVCGGQPLCDLEPWLGECKNTGGGDGGGTGGSGTEVATFGPSANPVKVTNYSNSGPKEDQIAAVFKKIGNALSSNTDCSGWLQGGGVQGADLIQALLDNSSFGYGDFNQNSVAAFAGQKNADGSSAGVPETAAITINANGAFFSSTASNGAGFVVGNLYAGGSLQAQATIVIHELAHVLGAAGFQPDAGNAAAGASNDALVNKNCGKLIGGLK